MRGTIIMKHTTHAQASTEILLQQLRQALPRLREEYDVEKLSIFGSYARNEQHVDSDLDILVSFRTTPGLIKYIELEQYLSDLLNVSVDLVMERALRPEIAARIQLDRQYV